MNGADVNQIKELLERPFARGGFMLEEQHFEVGRQLHIDHYFYVKQYFQSIENSKKVAVLLAEKIKSLKQLGNQFSIVACGDFSGPLIKETIKLIRNGEQSDLIKINYTIIDISNKQLSYLFHEQLYENILIVLPITCTFATAFDVKEFILKDADDPTQYNVIKEFITAFLIVDKCINSSGGSDVQNGAMTLDVESGEDCDVHLSDVKELYRNFGWKSLKNQTISFIDTGIYQGHYGSYLIGLDAVLYPAQKCPFCFPKKGEIERALFPTRVNHDTPNVVFGLPRFKNEFGRLGQVTFGDVFHKHENPGHLFGHLQLDSNSYLHFIERSVFYENNKKSIIDFIEKQLSELYPEFEEKEESILFITPSHQTASRILEDIADIPLFNNKSVTIIHTNPNNEFVENFLNDADKQVEHFKKIIFFDYVISGGKTFKIISDYLKYARKGQSGFDAMITIIDRTTEYSKKEILRKLKDDEKLAEKRFISYFKLNLPLTDAANSGNPIEVKNKTLHQIFAQCHLDSLKLSLRESILKGQPLSLDHLRRENTSYSPEKKYRSLLKLQVSHEISNWFYVFVQDKVQTASHFSDIKFRAEDLKKMILEVVLAIISDSPNRSINENVVRDIAVKTLTHSPFKYYKEIFRTVFEHVNQQLDILVEIIASNGYTIAGEEEIRRLNFYISRSVELNSNYIISNQFILFLKNVFKNRKNGLEILARMANCFKYYKGLAYNNPSRSIALESLLNTKDLLPDPILNSDLSLKETFNDLFYQLGRKLKAENIFLLNQLKQHFITNSDLPANLDIKEIYTFVENSYLLDLANHTNPIIRDVQSFLWQSKEIKLSKNYYRNFPATVSAPVKDMLATVYLISKSRKKTAFYEDIKSIIKQACKIIGDDLDFAFCIEYKDLGISPGQVNKENKYAANLYTILSAKYDDQATKISKNGLIYKMLYGIKETDSQSLQTFIALAKDQNGTYLSFREQYQEAEILSGERQQANDIDLNSAIEEDTRFTGSNVISDDAQMVLLFRLTEIDLLPGTTQKGQAVLVITSKEKATTKSLTDFLNMERLRLLLLIKEDLLGYLQKQFASDAFIGLLQSRRELEIKNSMEHMVGNYFDAMDSIIEFLPRSDDKILLGFLNRTVLRHIKSISQIQLNNVDFTKREYSQNAIYKEVELKELFICICKTPYLAPMPLFENEIRLDISVGDFACHPAIYEQVIPEIMINMRRYSIAAEIDTPWFVILKTDNKIRFENDYNPKNINDPAKIKKRGGKKMCDDLLVSLKYNVLEPIILPNNRFAIILDLN